MAKEKEYPVTQTPKAAPVQPKAAPLHPGEVLREDVLPALGLSVIEAAKGLRVSRQTLHRILSAKMAVSPEMAVRLGKFCGNGRRGSGFACKPPMTCGMPRGACALSSGEFPPVMPRKRRVEPSPGR